MSRLLKILVFVFGFLALTVSPSFGAGSCVAYRPENPAVDLLIKGAQARGGAAALVPASVIKAVYFIEALPYYATGAFTCKKNQYTALGLWQIVDGEYHSTVPENEQLDNDETICTDTNCKLSRCNPVDAIEIFSRALLDKIKLWHESKLKPLGKIESIEDIMYSTGRYYGLFVPDQYTNNLIEYLPQNQRYPSGHQNTDTITYPEFVCAKSGYCKTYQDYLDRNHLGSTYLNYSGKKSDVPFTFDACGQPTTPPISTNFKFHPLRPFANQPIAGDPPLTTYCAMRPVSVELNRHDKRSPTTKIFTIGNLTQDFTSFITPLLSITDPAKPDFALPYTDKAQRYLLDYLEGRAYYEPVTEPLYPNADLFNRLGVFRKLAPQTYQDQLKKAIIFRAAGAFDQLTNPYGFEPATETIHNYVVGYWHNSQAWASNYAKGEKITLKDYYTNKAWAPLPEDYPDSGSYSDVYRIWKLKDDGKWASLWPYVPMFTREDTKGYIQVLDDPGQTSTPKQVEVIHPHLARAYEVSTALSYLLSPLSTHNAPTPQLEEQWYTPAPWNGPEAPWWMTAATPEELGPLCDFNSSVKLISSSGDQAKESLINTRVNRSEILAPNPFYDPTADDPEIEYCQGQPITHDSCEKLTQNCGIDDSGCYVYREARFTPNYLITYTPFLDQILTSLTQSPRGIFNLFNPSVAEKEPFEKTDWPGVGNIGEESPKYDFQAASRERSYAEAGYHQPGDSQSFLYRYLGTIQCAKERTMSVLQPFITGQPYTPYAYECFPELTPPAGQIPTGPKWLQWPCENAYIEDDRLAVCYEDPDRPFHKGLDLQCPNGTVFPAAPGSVVAVNRNPDAHGFGIYVIIDHGNGWFTLYAHLDKAFVSVGDYVYLTTKIGIQNNSGKWSQGSHLHLGLSKGKHPNHFLNGGPTADPCQAINGCSCK